MFVTLPVGSFNVVAHKCLFWQWLEMPACSTWGHQSFRNFYNAVGLWRSLANINSHISRAFCWWHKTGHSDISILFFVMRGTNIIFYMEVLAGFQWSLNWVSGCSCIKFTRGAHWVNLTSEKRVTGSLRPVQRTKGVVLCLSYGNKDRLEPNEINK